MHRSITQFEQLLCRCVSHRLVNKGDMWLKECSVLVSHILSSGAESVVVTVTVGGSLEERGLTTGLWKNRKIFNRRCDDVFDWFVCFALFS